MTRRYTGYSYDNIISPAIEIDTTQDWTMMGWVYPATLTASGGDLCFITEYPGAPNALQSYIGWGYNEGNPVLRFTCGDGSTRVLNRYHTITTGSWYHLALVYDASESTITAYVNGAQVEQQEITIPWEATFVEVGDFTFGSNDIEIAQVKMWEGYAISVGELADEIDYWTPQHGTGQVKAWWQFDNADQLSDSSGNGHTLVWDEAGSFSTPGAGVQTVPGELAPPAYTEAAGAITATVAMGGAPTVNRAVAGAIASTLAMVGSPAVTRAAVGAITATAAMAGAPEHRYSAAGAIATVAVMAGAAERVIASVVNVAGAISASFQMSGVVQITRAVAGAVGAQVVMSGAPNRVSAPLPVSWRADPTEGTYTAHSAWISNAS